MASTSGPKGPTPARQALAAKVAQLHQRGLLQREIGERLGIGRTYVSDLLRDPDGTKARERKDRYRQPCPNCGRPMTGNYGKNRSSAHCAECAPLFFTGKWTDAQIIETFRRFHALTGRAPTTTDATGLAPSQRRKLSSARVAELEAAYGLVRLPPPAVVRARLGGWPQAVRAAGLEPSRTGEPSHRGPRRFKLGTVERRILASLSAGPMTAEELGENSRSRDGSRMKKLGALGFVTRERIGRKYLYALAPGGAAALIEEEDSMAARNDSGVGWVVLKPTRGSIDGDTVTLKIVGRLSAPTRAIAAERAAGSAGEYLVVRAAEWRLMTLAPVERLTALPDDD